MAVTSMPNTAFLLQHNYSMYPQHALALQCYISLPQIRLTALTSEYDNIMKEFLLKHEHIQLNTIWMSVEHHNLIVISKGTAAANRSGKKPADSLRLLLFESLLSCV